MATHTMSVSSTAVALLPTMAPAIGTGIGDRIGAKIFVTNIYVRVLARMGNNNALRLIIIKPRDDTYAVDNTLIPGDV